MTDFIPIQIPITLYERLQAVAKHTGRSVEAVLADSIEVMFGAAPIDEMQMATYADEQLWAAVHRRLAIPLEERLNALIARGKAQAPSPGGEAELESLLDEADRLIVVRAKALSLLKERGQDVSAYVGG